LIHNKSKSLHEKEKSAFITLLVLRLTVEREKNLFNEIFKYLIKLSIVAIKALSPKSEYNFGFNDISTSSKRTEII